MKKTIYIIPAVRVYQTNMPDGILLSGSNDGNSVLGAGEGGTSSLGGGGSVSADVHSDSGWDIWGDD